MWDYSEAMDIVREIREAQAKEEQISKREAEETVQLSEMAKLFMVEKAKSTQADKVRQYEIAFEYLYSLIGEDCNILNFDREQAV